MTQLTAYELVNTVHSWAISLPISENNLECLKCGHKARIDDLDSDESLCGVSMTKQERDEIIKTGEFPPSEKYLLKYWFGNGCC